MNLEPEPQPEPSLAKWSEDERQEFLGDRTRLLQRLLHSRQSWQATHERLGGRSTLKITWIDHQGQEQQTLLTESFLAGYATVMRAVACDLIICGEDGAQIAEHLFADLSGIDGEQDA
jgi:hypothetical protein